MVKGFLDRNALEFAAGVRVRLAHGDEIFVQLNGLVQPLPGLVQAIGAVSDRDAIATVVKWHSFGDYDGGGRYLDNPTGTSRPRWGYQRTTTTGNSRRIGAIASN